MEGRETRTGRSMEELPSSFSVLRRFNRPDVDDVSLGLKSPSSLLSDSSSPSSSEKLNTFLFFLPFFDRLHFRDGADALGIGVGDND